MHNVTGGDERRQYDTQRYRQRLAETRINYLGMSERASRARKEAQELRSRLEKAKQLEVDYKRVVAQRNRLRRQVTDFRAQIKDLKRQSRKLMRSRRYRVGNALARPIDAMATARRRRHQKATPTNEHTRSPAVVIKDSSEPSPQPPKLSDLTLDQLRERMNTVGNTAAKFDYISRCFYEYGMIQESWQTLETMDVESIELTKAQRLLVRRISGARAMSKIGLNVPVRQRGANYLSEPNSVLYCAHQARPFDSNGYAVRTAGMAQGLLNHGINVVVAARPGYPWSQTSRYKSVPPTRRHVDIVDGVSYVFNPGPSLEDGRVDHYILESADTLVREATRQRASIIHAASNHVLGLAALIAARRLGIPFVYEVRGFWEQTRASVRPMWANSEHHNLQRQYESFVAKEADHVLAITEEVRNEIVRDGTAPERVTVAPNSVDTEAFAPLPPDQAIRDELGIDDTVPTVGFAGSVIEYEGLDLLVEAMDAIAKEGTSFNAVIVGDGPALADVKRQVHTYGLTDRVRFPGRVGPNEVTRYLSVMDVLPVPRRSTGVTELVSALKPIEAMANGKAVLLSDVSPHRTLADNGQRAALFESGSSEALADALGRLLSDQEARAKLGARARLWTVDQRTWTVTAQQVVNAHEAARGVHTSLVPEPRQVAQLSVLMIADRFTKDTLTPDVTAHFPTPGDWRDILSTTRIDALLVESAWNGNEGAWARRVGYYSDEEIGPLATLVSECRRRGIPTIFWNKEDPVHFQRFSRTAALFDHVFTTDANQISAYLQLSSDANRTVSSWPFYAQPRIHNLNRSGDGERLICYGGTYYGARYPERTKALDPLLRAAEIYGLAIYDRQHMNPDSPYEFPSSSSAYVRGGLEYSEMTEAYRRHPIHLNVNSVHTSPTMFSRRVPEIVASGSSVVSGPGRGVIEVMAGHVPVASNETEAIDAIRRWYEDEVTRHAELWPAFRHVLRAHSAEHRLVYAFRTAGLVVSAPTLPTYEVGTTLGDKRVRSALAAQTVQPAVAPRGDGNEPEPYGPEADWILEFTPSSPAMLEPTDLEDLLRVARETDAATVGLTVESPAGGIDATLPMVRKERGVKYDICLRRRRLEDAGAVSDQQETTTVVKYRSLRPVRELPGDLPSEPRLLVAGHDLKFITPITAELETRGYEVIVDQWRGHAQHDENRSLRLIRAADVVLCEWTLGNAVWYTRNRRAGQRIVARFHSQELFSPLLRHVDFRGLDALVFVAPHILDIAVRDHGLPSAKARVIPNAVDTSKLDREKRVEASRQLGLVGITPKLKRLDLALEILARLRRMDDSFTLRIKGKLPEDYPWMRDRADEMAFFEEQYQRIATDPLLSDAVVFDDHGNDMDEWYREIGYGLSLSDFEAFHLTVADTAASGAIPLVLPWLGADRIYPARWISPTLEKLVERVLSLSDSEYERTTAVTEGRAYVQEHFSLGSVVDRLSETLFPAR